MADTPVLRIGLVGPLPPPSGGMANQTRQLAQLLRDEGLVVEFVQVNAPYRPAWAAKLKGVRALFRLVPYLFMLWRVAGRSDVFHIMANSGWSWHLFAAPAVWIASWRHVQVVVNYRGGEAESFFLRAFRWVRPTLKRTNVIMVPTGFLASVFSKWQVDTTIIPNIVNTERFSPASSDTRASLHIGHSQRPASRDTRASLHIVVTRNLEPIYDIASAIDAFIEVEKHYSEARMTIAGSGPDKESLQAKIDSLDLSDKITLCGRLEVDEVVSLYQHADVMLNPSLADNMPNSVLESLASGVPVVSTNVGGVPYLVEHGVTALLVEPGDSEAMADAIITLHVDSPLRDALVDAGMQLVKQYTWPQVREKLIPMYRGLL